MRTMRVGAQHPQGRPWGGAPYFSGMPSQKELQGLLKVLQRVSTRQIANTESLGDKLDKLAGIQEDQSSRLNTVDGKLDAILPS